MQSTSTLESILRRDRYIVIAGLAAVVLLAWSYTVFLAWDMRGMGMESGVAIHSEMAMMDNSVGQTMLMPMTAHWTALDFGLMLSMWAVMMMAMMVPSAAPMILTFGAFSRKLRERERPYVPTGIFVLGYIAAWGGFALFATLAQWGLHATAFVSPMGVSTDAVLGGTLLLTAGIFQWTPLKYSCLTSCRSPLGFLMSEWRSGSKGALIMGIRHGNYCLGCCWMLMALLFVLGVMNLVWIAALAGLVMVEKVVPRGQEVSKLSGIGLAGWGLWMLAGAAI